MPDHAHSSAIKALDAAPFYSVAKVAGLAWLAVHPAPRRVHLSRRDRPDLSHLRVADQLRPEQERLHPRDVRAQLGTTPRSGGRHHRVRRCIGLLFLLPFPSWSKLVGVVTSASVLMYAGAPLALGALRLQKPDLPRPYRLPAAHIMAPLGFVLATFIVYWAGWSTYTTLMVALLIGYALMLALGGVAPQPQPAAGRLGGGRLDLPVPDRDGRGLILRRLRRTDGGRAGSSAASASSRRCWSAATNDARPVRRVARRRAPGAWSSTTSPCRGGCRPRRSTSTSPRCTRRRSPRDRRRPGRMRPGAAGAGSRMRRRRWRACAPPNNAQLVTSGRFVGVDLAALGLLDQRGRRLEALAVALGQLARAGDEAGQAAVRSR